MARSVQHYQLDSRLAYLEVCVQEPSDHHNVRSNVEHITKEGHSKGRSGR